MAIRKSPGVYVTEIDLTGGFEQVGTGGIGVAAKLEKGAIGVPFTVTSNTDLKAKGGMPIPGFNLVSWYSIDNMLVYTDSVTVSRVEKTTYSAKHDATTQIFDIPVNLSQIGVTLSGDAVPFNFSDELNDMIKNREIFRTTNVSNAFDFLNQYNGIDIQDVDNALLIENDNVLQQYADDNAFDTKAKKLYKMPKIGKKTVVKDEFVPDIVAGQVYNHHGKIVSIGENVYTDTYVLEVLANEVTDGVGSVVRLSTDSSGLTLKGTGTAFSTELKSKSSITLYWNNTYSVGTGTIGKDATNYSKVINTSGSTHNNNFAVISAGYKIKDDTLNLEKVVDYVETNKLATFSAVPANGKVFVITLGATVETYEFNTGAVTPGNIKVDTTGLTLPAQAATALKNTITANTVEFTEILMTLNTVYLELYTSRTYKTLFDTIVFSTDTTDITLAANTHVLYVTTAYTTSQLPIGTPTAFHYAVAHAPSTLIVDSVFDDETLTVTVADTSIPTELDATGRTCTFTYLYGETQDEVTTITERFYRDATDTTNTTLIGVNMNAPMMLRIGTKLTFDLSGSPYTKYVASIDSYNSSTNTSVIHISSAFSQLTSDVTNAVPFIYANVYFTTSDIEVDTNVYTSNGAVLNVIAQDESNTPSNLYRYLVKVVSGTPLNGDIANGALLNSSEWSFITSSVYNTYTVDKSENMYIFDLTYDNASYRNVETGDTLYFSHVATHVARTTYTGLGLVKFVTNIGGTNKLVLEIQEDGTTGSTSTISKDDKFSKITTGYWDDVSTALSNTGTITFINQYEDVLIYENNLFTADDMVMVNEDVANMDTTIKNRYSYYYKATGNPAIDKIEYVVTDTITGNSIAATEFIRIFASSAGSWVNNQNITIAMCDYDHYNAGATVEAGGITFKSLFEFTPTNFDETFFAIIVIANDLIVEKYLVSTYPKSKDYQNISQYCLDVVNRQSGLIRILINTSLFNRTAPNGYNIHFNTMYASSLEYGYSCERFNLMYQSYYANPSNIYLTINTGYVSNADVEAAYDIFANKDEVDLSYLTDGEWAGNPTIASYLVTLAVNRGDVIAILGPNPEDIVGIKDVTTIQNNMLAYVNDNGLVNGDRASQFAGFFANVKQIKDDINDMFIWLPISADVAGINASVDAQFEPWYAAAGMTRGNIRNLYKLGWNAGQDQRDVMYPNRINAVVYFKGEGNVVLGVRSLCSRKSDLGDIYNRKTLNLIEKNLAKYLRQVLYEFNDAITRSQVLSNIEPYLRSIRGRRGLIDYKAQCDESNNPLSVVENNQLNCYVYLKMAHVIETVGLQFTITKASVSFNESIV